MGLGTPRAPLNTIGGGRIAGATRGYGNVGTWGGRGGYVNRGTFGGTRINNFGGSSYGINQNVVNRNYIGNRSYGGYGYGNRGYGGYGGYSGFGGRGYGYGYPGYGFGSGLGGGLGLGLLLGYGLGGFGGYGGYGRYGGYSNWGYPSYYGSSYGTTVYVNPYVTAGDLSGTYGYAQPVVASAALPADTVAAQPPTLLGQARDAFMAGDPALALTSIDAALARNPNETSALEFRALCLFALGRYDEAAVPLHSVLAVGPGWDWVGLSDFYPDVNVYTAQLRRLEAYTGSNPNSSPSRFVLAYHYLATGYPNDAARRLSEVIALNPTDAVASNVLKQINGVPVVQPSPPTPSGGLKPTSLIVPAVPATPINRTVPEGATIQGVWAAKPDADSSVTMTIQADGTFEWNLARKDQPKRFTGVSTFSNGILTLVPEGVPPIVGRIGWADSTHMTFHAVGDESNGPGLAFAKP